MSLRGLNLDDSIQKAIKQEELEIYRARQRMETTKGITNLEINEDGTVKEKILEQYVLENSKTLMNNSNILIEIKERQRRIRNLKREL